MALSLRTYTIVPFLAAGLSAAAAIGWLVNETHQEQRRAIALIETREALTNAFGQLSQRHQRTVLRARGALRQIPAENGMTMLTWTTEHYQPEITRLISAADGVVAQLALPDAHPRLLLDRDRLDRQLDLIESRSRGVSAALDLLLGAATADSPEATIEALQALDRADAIMTSALRRAHNLAERALAWQARHGGAPQPLGFLVLILGVLAVFSAALIIALLPHRRLAALSSAVGDRPKAFLTREEQAIAHRLTQLEGARLEAQIEANEQTRTTEASRKAARRAERELALLRLLNENLVNSLRSAVIVTDTSHRVTSFNRRGRVLMALDEEALGRPIHELPLFRALEARIPAAASIIDEGVTEGRLHRFEGIAVRPRDGDQERLFDLTVAPYLDEGGAARGLLWVTDDVTEAVRTKNQLLDAEHLAAVGRLSAQVAHEIRNPLSAIGLNAELLEDELAAAALTDDRREEGLALLRGISAEVDRLQQVTESYLQLTRIPRPQCQPTDLNLVVTDLFNMLREEMRAHGIQVDLSLASPAPVAWIDPGQLRQALINVVRNSREAMSEGGTLRVVTEARVGELSPDDPTPLCRLTVTDSGPGIPDLERQRVFEPFYTTKPTGRGLGMATVLGILRAHRGAVHIKTAPGAGTRIRIAFPAA